MARRCAFFLMVCLFCIHFTTALAVAPRQKRVRNHTPTQNRRKTTVFPKKAPRVASKATSNAAAPTKQNDATKKHRRVAEEMVMQRAWMYSAVLPGWGQVYNAHYWKVPVIYAGFAGFFGGAIYYHREYLESKKGLKKQENSSQYYVNECRMGRDLCVILGALWYVVNIFDAYVGASLKTFTLSDDVSMEVGPTMLPTTRNLPSIGLSLTLSFKNENTTDRLWKNGAGH